MHTLTKKTKPRASTSGAKLWALKKTKISNTQEIYKSLQLMLIILIHLKKKRQLGIRIYSNNNIIIQDTYKLTM